MPPESWGVSAGLRVQPNADSSSRDLKEMSMRHHLKNIRNVVKSALSVTVTSGQKKEKSLTILFRIIFL